MESTADTADSEKQRLGIFLSGFRWSGSSAVSDWLEIFSILKKPENTETANDEIRALNYGLTFLLKSLEKPLFTRETLARLTMYPDRAGWNEVFGKPLSAERGFISPVLRLLDCIFMALASGRLNPPPDSYGYLLKQSLYRDFRSDTEYREALASLAMALRDSLKNPSPGRDSRDSLESFGSLKKSVSSLLALFYDRMMKEKGNILVFDNAVSGLNPRYYHLVDRESFDTQLIIFVMRDPRDQFAEQVKYSTRTFPFMVPGFVSDYLKLAARTEKYVSELSALPGRTVRLINFEDFVCDTGGTRTGLKQLISKMLDSTGFEWCFNPDAYSADESKKNTGVWKQSSMKREIKYIEKKLAPFLREQAD